MGKTSSYVAREADSSGFVQYTDDEHQIWHELYARQVKAIKGKACDEFMTGLDLLNLPKDRVPQLGEVSKILKRETGWEVAYVPALIPFSQFFALLADRKFPAATFVRTREELDYLQEPDIFHEIFGHTPLLTNKAFADFTHTYGKLGLAASKEDRVFLARMYWFTVEFGLVDPSSGGTAAGIQQRPAMDGRAGLSEEVQGPAKDGIANPANSNLRIYGGGILSSIGETDYALSDVPQRKRFSMVDALRTPYRIDIMQPLYYVLENLGQLDEIARSDIMAQVETAKQLGLYAPLFPPKTKTSKSDGPPKVGTPPAVAQPKHQAA